MTKQMKNAAAAPKAVGPYSHSVLTEENLYISGQLGIDPASGKMQPDVAAQARQGMENLGAILKESGLDYGNVAKTTIFLTSMQDFKTVNEIYSEYFSDWLPARSCVAVKELPLGGLFEIEAIAVK